MLKAKTSIASQAKDFYIYQNTKMKLLNCIEDVVFNKRCLQKRPHPELCKYKNTKHYGSSKMYKTGHNNSVCNMEFNFIKTQNLKQELLKLI
jgi:hypothetical protein